MNDTPVPDLIHRTQANAYTLGSIDTLVEVNRLALAASTLDDLRRAIAALKPKEMDK